MAVKSKNLEIGAYWCPSASEENYKSVADCGIDFLFLDQKLGEPNSPDYLRALEFCGKYGIRGMVGRSDMRVKSEDDGQRLADNYIENGIDYTEYSGFGGVNVYDEPNYTALDYLENAVLRVEKKYPDYETSVNLFSPHTGFNDTDVTYEQYLTKCAEKILCKLSGRKVLSLDVYPMLTENTAVADYFLPAVELSTRIAAKYGLETRFYLQSIFQGEELAPGLREINYDTLSLQAYTYLAYGCRSLVHFLYYHQNLADNQVMINGKGEKTQQWYYAEKLNKEIKAAKDIYLRYTFDKMMPVYAAGGGANTRSNLKTIEQVNKLCGIKSVQTDADALISENTDGCGDKAYMLVNYNDKDYEKFAGKLDLSARIEFESASSLTVVYHGESFTLANGYKCKKSDCPAEFAFEDGTLTVSGLEAGQGVFLAVSR